MNVFIPLEVLVVDKNVVGFIGQLYDGSVAVLQ